MVLKSSTELYGHYTVDLHTLQRWAKWMKPYAIYTEIKSGIIYSFNSRHQTPRRKAEGLRGSGITTARPPALWQGPCSWAPLVPALWRRRATVFIKCKTELRAFNNCLSLLKFIYLLLLFSPQRAHPNRSASGYRARPRRGCAGGGAGPVPPARSHLALRWRRPGREALAAEGARR